MKRFGANLSVLAAILQTKPKSAYELAKYLRRDASNLSKELRFLKKMGILRFETEITNGRLRKMPLLLFTKFEFDLEIRAEKKSVSRQGVLRIARGR
ncbi:MAG: ArsR family transcriptional regulator [Cryobacterium sp.]|nr:ArsR family transcriptional regulator [Oligoflexia bacterium]